MSGADFYLACDLLFRRPGWRPPEESEDRGFAPAAYCAPGRTGGKTGGTVEDAATASRFAACTGHRPAQDLTMRSAAPRVSRCEYTRARESGLPPIARFRQSQPCLSRK